MAICISVAAAIMMMGMSRTPEAAPLKCDDSFTSCFDGHGLPGAGGAAHDLWDNAVDDDWKEASFRRHVWLINQQAEDGTAYMRVDRTRIDGPGWIMRRDAQISPASGVEIFMKVRIPERSTPDGVALIYIDRESHFAVALEPGRILINPVGNQRAREQKRRRAAGTIDLAVGFKMLVVRKYPDSEKVEVFVREDDALRLLASGTASRTARPQGVVGHITRISLGDNQDDYRSATMDTQKLNKARGVFDLAFIGWRPMVEGATASPELPETPEQHTLPAGGKPWLWHPPVTKRLSGAGQTHVPLGPIDTKHDLLVEWRFRFTDAVPNGFHFSWLDAEYSYSLVAYEDRVQAKLYGKPVGALPVQPKGWNPSGWTCLRLFRPAGSVNAQLYMNDDPVPVIGAIRGGSSGKRQAFVIFGGNSVPETPAQAWAAHNDGKDLPGLGRYKVPVQVDVVRVSRARLSAASPCATSSAKH